VLGCSDSSDDLMSGKVIVLGHHIHQLLSPVGKEIQRPVKIVLKQIRILD